MGKRFGFVLAGAAALALAVTAVVFAASGGAGSAADATRASGPSVAQATGAGGGGCKMGFDTENTVLIPPSDATLSNPPAGVVTFTKGCSGAAVGQFTSEVSTGTSGGGFIHLDMRATCIGTGGFAAPVCTVGQEVLAAPGHTFLDNTQHSATEVHGMNMVWPALPRGKWKFEALPGGNGSSSLDYRTFTVEAY